MSRPGSRMFAPGSGAPAIVTSSPRVSACSRGTTASAPSGTTPPVAIRIAVPGRSGSRAGCPAADSPATGSVPGRSPARTAKPSIAELRNGGRSTRAGRGLGEHASRRVADRHGFRLERPGVLEDEPDRVVEREEVAHRGG